MIKQLSLFTIVLFVASMAHSQTWFTRNGKISFFSHTAVEDIKAENNEVVCSFNGSTGELNFQALIKGFVFPKATMQEHFNGAQYLDSDQFPQSSFKGTITNLKTVNLKKEGTYPVKVQGNLTMHGVTKPITTDGSITVAKGVITAKATFQVDREAFGIVVPAYAGSKIAKTIEVTVDCTYTGQRTAMLETNQQVEAAAVR
jgi:polyisoprenoid-binding protein YceI